MLGGQGVMGTVVADGGLQRAGVLELVLSRDLRGVPDLGAAWCPPASPCPCCVIARPAHPELNPHWQIQTRAWVAAVPQHLQLQQMEALGPLCPSHLPTAPCPPTKTPVLLHKSPPGPPGLGLTYKMPLFDYERLGSSCSLSDSSNGSGRAAARGGEGFRGCIKGGPRGDGRQGRLSALPLRAARSDPAPWSSPAARSPRGPRSAAPAPHPAGT